MASLLPPITSGFVRATALPLQRGGCFYSSKGLLEKVSDYCVGRIQTACALKSVKYPAFVKEEGVFDKNCDQRYRELFIKQTQEKMDELRKRVDSE
ncbi:MAG: hypothetical protein K2P51_04910 [Rhabdochlamydiaceae bacterium]|nr:hypothetical protein [Rhabdochlamydiaceae bacterium]